MLRAVSRGLRSCRGLQSSKMAGPHPLPSPGPRSSHPTAPGPQAPGPHCPQPGPCAAGRAWRCLEALGQGCALERGLLPGQGGDSRCRRQPPGDQNDRGQGRTAPGPWGWGVRLDQVRWRQNTSLDASMSATSTFSWESHPGVPHGAAAPGLEQVLLEPVSCVRLPVGRGSSLGHPALGSWARVSEDEPQLWSVPVPPSLSPPERPLGLVPAAGCVPS